MDLTLTKKFPRRWMIAEHTHTLLVTLTLSHRVNISAFTITIYIYSRPLSFPFFSLLSQIFHSSACVFIVQMAHNNRYLQPNQFGNVFFISIHNCFLINSMLNLCNWLTLISIVTDIQQILSEAQYRWLRPAEICQILTNYNHFQITSEPANMPPSMIDSTF